MVNLSMYEPPDYVLNVGGKEFIQGKSEILVLNGGESWQFWMGQFIHKILMTCFLEVTTSIGAEWMLRATPMHSTLDSVGISTDLNKQIQLSSFECQHCRCFGLFWSPVAKWSFRLPNTKVGSDFWAHVQRRVKIQGLFFVVVVVVVVAVAVAVVVVVVPSLTFWMDLNGPNFLMASLVSRWRLGSEAVVGRPWQSWLWRCHQRDEWGWDFIFMGFWEGWNKSLTGCSDGYALKATKEVRSKLLVTKTEYIFWSRVLNLFHSSTALALCHAGVGFAFTNGWHESIFYTWAEGEYSCKAAGGDFMSRGLFMALCCLCKNSFTFSSWPRYWTMVHSSTVLEGIREQGRGVNNVTQVAWIWRFSICCFCKLSRD